MRLSSFGKSFESQHRTCGDSYHSGKVGWCALAIDPCSELKEAERKERPRTYTHVQSSTESYRKEVLRNSISKPLSQDIDSEPGSLYWYMYAEHSSRSGRGVQPQLRQRSKEQVRSDVENSAHYGVLLGLTRGQWAS